MTKSRRLEVTVGQYRGRVGEHVSAYTQNTYRYYVLRTVDTNELIHVRSDYIKNYVAPKAVEN